VFVAVLNAAFDFVNRFVDQMCGTAGMTAVIMVLIGEQDLLLGVAERCERRFHVRLRRRKRHAGEKSSHTNASRDENGTHRYPPLLISGPISRFISGAL
jgi:hypothetical protein